MNEPMRTFEELAGRARQEAAPEVDTVAAVLRRVRAYEEPADYSLAVFAAGSFITAAATAVIVVSTLSPLIDPMGDMFQILPMPLM